MLGEVNVPEFSKFGMKSDVTETAWNKPEEPWWHRFSRACRNVSRSCGFSQLGKNALDEVALSVLGPIRQS